MAEPIEFYFDFSSPYGYLASRHIGDLAARQDRGVMWRPYLLGAAFQVNDQVPLVAQPMKGPYSLHDLNRLSRLWDIPFTLPDPFPVPTQAAGRIFYFLHDGNAELAKTFAAAVYAAYFVDNVDIRKRDAVADIAAGVGADRNDCLEATNADAYKRRLKDETQAAIDRGVFGSPYFFVDGEPFWGTDRMDMMERWLETGGW